MLIVIKNIFLNELGVFCSCQSGMFKFWPCRWSNPQVMLCLRLWAEPHASAWCCTPVARLLAGTKVHYQTLISLTDLDSMTRLLHAQLQLLSQRKPLPSSLELSVHSCITRALLANHSTATFACLPTLQSFALETFSRPAFWLNLLLYLLFRTHVRFRLSLIESKSLLLLTLRFLLHKLFLIARWTWICFFMITWILWISLYPLLSYCFVSP